MTIDQSKLYIPGDVLGTLKRCGGYYKRPQVGDPLVGYASTYLDLGEERKHFVGYEFFNCTKAQEYPRITELWAKDMARMLSRNPDMGFDVLLAAPMGGIMFAQMLALKLSIRVMYAVKKITKKSSGEHGRDTSELTLDRHKIEKGWRIAIVDDVCNNFGTVGKLIRLAGSYGAKVETILCIVNRSGRRNHVVDQHNRYSIPMLSLVTVPAIKFRQDDREVATDVRKNNVFWDPKNPDQWSRLMEIMKKRESE